MIVLPNMGLVKWDSLNDPFSHEQLAANFGKLDEHDHTAGKGKQIPYGGLAEQAVGSENLREGVFNANAIANESIETSKIKGLAITEPKLANGAVTSPKFKPTSGFIAASGGINPVGISMTDVPGTSATITPTVESYLFIWSRFIGFNKEAAAATLSGEINVDGLGQSTNIEASSAISGESGKIAMSGFARVTLSAAAHTVKLRAKSSNGNMAVQQAGTEYFYFLVTK